MAKRKRAPRRDKSSDTQVLASEKPTEDNDAIQEAATQYVGQWNRLVSTTNWEKGRIICQWRDSLVESGTSVTEYSDEAWAQLVGNVTSQHVGRLRRVFQRFGDVFDQYEGLYWSHFQAALDWDDAEMWLEGSIQNQWSVSQMRGKRWETLGTPPEQQRSELEQEASQVEEESAAEASSDAAEKESERVTESLTPSTTSIKPAEKQDKQPAEESGEGTRESAGDVTAPGESQPASQVSKRTRLKVDVESLPDDVAEAFESFKLAIIAHRREGWRETTPEALVECLDALKELALVEEDE